MDGGTGGLPHSYAAMGGGQVDGPIHMQQWMDEGTWRKATLLRLEVSSPPHWPLSPLTLSISAVSILPTVSDLSTGKEVPRRVLRSH